MLTEALKIKGPVTSFWWSEPTFGPWRRCTWKLLRRLRSLRVDGGVSDQKPPLRASDARCGLAIAVTGAAIQLLLSDHGIRCSGVKPSPEAARRMCTRNCSFWTRRSLACFSYRSCGNLFAVLFPQDVINKRCKFEGGCNTQPSYGFAGERPSRCKEHMLPGMGNTRSKLCAEPECQIRPLFGYWGETAPSRCKAHSLPGQTNILHLQCSHPTCHQRPVIFGLPDEPKPKRCAQHALEGMVDFREKLATVAEKQPAEEPVVAPAASDALVLPQQND